MKKLAIVVVIIAPSIACGQYIGNPCGKVVPRGAPSERFPDVAPFIGLDFGFGRFDVEADYWLKGAGLRLTEKETSVLREGYFAFSAGCNINGLELEGRLGGTRIELREDYFDPYEDGDGILTGFGVRYGFSPAEFVRLGIGGQMQYSHTDGEAVFRDDGYVLIQDMVLDLLRGQIFTGASLDLDAGPDLVFSPYAGAGLEFLYGEVSEDEWFDWESFEEWGIDIEEKRVGFIFGGLDMHIGRRARIGLEARTNFDGWLAQVSFGIRF